MIKFIKDNHMVLTEEQQEELYWDDWVHNSHRWIEEVKGYYKCSFCGVGYTSMMPIGLAKICKKNPYINENI